NADRLTSAADPAAAYTYGYDNADRLISDSRAATASVQALALTYGYDGRNNRTSLLDDLGTGGGLTYNYNDNHRLTGMPWRVNGTDVAQMTFHYDARNRLDGINRIAAGTAVNTAIGLDPDDRVTTMQHSFGGTTLALTYSYDQAGRLDWS